tara:strand:- start:1100 stop:1459 length:360 start_codon:yes stop_codon:yes gene_type:complete
MESKVINIHNLVTPETWAKAAGISKVKVYNMIKPQEMKPTKVDGKEFIDVSLYDPTEYKSQFSYEPVTQMEKLIYSLLDRLKADNPSLLNVGSIMKKYSHLTRKQCEAVLDRWNKNNKE